jgi:DNA-directed RNA polymerase specialized sigma24 family protein
MHLVLSGGKDRRFERKRPGGLAQKCYLVLLYCVGQTFWFCDAGYKRHNSFPVINEVSKSDGQFSTTRWSVVLLAGQAMSPECTAALEKLCRTYWQPVYIFARRKGWSEEDAKDLTQQFFAHLLERNDFRGLDPARGKFRTFMLVAFTHFLANEHDRVCALKRGGGRTVVSLDQIPPEELGDLSPTEELSPGTLYDVRWARTILQAALQQLKTEMSSPAKEGQFDGLKQFLTDNAGAGEYTVVAGKLGVEIASVPVMVHRLRQRYRELVRQEVAQTVSSPTELEEEMRHLFALLSR